MMRSEEKPILPGSVIGVLGSGQLGRMFAIAARQMGYRVHTYSPDEDTPTGQVADVEIKGAYDDLEAVRKFARGVSVVTFEFENVPAATAEACASVVPVRPAGEVLHISQHRLREKTFLKAAGFPVVPHEVVRNAGQVLAAAEKLGLPAVLKSAGWGYDGKGQRKITQLSECNEAWMAVAMKGNGQETKAREAVLEAYVDFACELSVVGVRGTRGEFAEFGAVENIHRNHILDVTLAPARVEAGISARAVEITRGVMEKLEVVGVLCVEFFVTKAGELLINEMAPRPHNSGHFTIDACRTSQFAQQVRAVCGLPLGDTTQLAPAAMVNLLGDLWDAAAGKPDWAGAMSVPGVSVHLYGKMEARPGRKMGHITATGATLEQARERAVLARNKLTRTA